MSGRKFSDRASRVAIDCQKASGVLLESFEVKPTMMSQSDDHHVPSSRVYHETRRKWDETAKTRRLVSAGWLVSVFWTSHRLCLVSIYWEFRLVSCWLHLTETSRDDKTRWSHRDKDFKFLNKAWPLLTSNCKRKSGLLVFRGFEELPAELAKVRDHLKLFIPGGVIVESSVFRTCSLVNIIILK